MDAVTQNNFYASSILFGRKSKGDFFGLKFKNKSKSFTLRLHVVCWQTWCVELYKDETPVTSFYLVQIGEKTPTLELRNSRVYPRGYNFDIRNAEVYTN